MTVGIILAVLAAASFGFNGATVRRGVSTGAASHGMYVTIFVGLPLFIVASLASGQLFDADRMTANDYGLLIAGGLLHILVGRYFSYRAIAAIGANRAGPVIGTSTLISVLIAVVSLSEEVTPLMGIGIVLVIIGPAFVAPRRSRAPVAVAAAGPSTGDAVASNPKMAEGYVFGFMTALLWGVGPVLMRAGVEGTGLGIWGGTVTYASAAVVLAFSLLIPGQLHGAINLDKAARWWFLAAAVNSFLANVFRFSALALAPVTIVVPLMRTFVIFQLGFNLLINRKLETFEPRVLGGITISFLGAALLVL